MRPDRGRRRDDGVHDAPIIDRWECHCQEPPVLLATYDESGTISIKARDRYWTVHGTVSARCPRCGTEQTLDLKTRRSLP